MALVTTALAFVHDYVPYERPPQEQTLWSAIPRGLFTGIINAGTLDAKPVSDSQRLTCTMTLPGNFGYVMSECQLSIFQNRSVDWDPDMYVEFTNFIRGAFGNVQGLVAHYYQDLLDTSLATYSVPAVSMRVSQAWPSMPMIAASSGSPIIFVINANNQSATVATAGTVMAFASFWQFDLEQIRKFPINSPQPVHAR